MPAILPIKSILGNSKKYGYNLLEMVTKSRRYHPSKFSRFVIYPIGFVVFAAILYFIILLANGYRFTFKNSQIVWEKTGIIILSTRPNDAQILINGKPTGINTGFSFLTTRINDLLPAKYRVTIKKDGFRTWEKEAEVKANLVTWLNYIIMFPNELKIDKINDLKDKEILAQSKNKRLMLIKAISEPALYTYDQNGNLAKIWPRNFIPQEEWLKQPEILAAEFNSNNDKILLKIKNQDKASYAILDTSTDGKITSLDSFSFTKLIWNPLDSNELFGLSAGNVYRLPIANFTPVELAKNVVDYTVEKNGQIYFVSNNGEKISLLQMGFDGNRKEVVAGAVVKNDRYKMTYSASLDALAFLPLDEKTLTIYYKSNNQLSTVELANNVNDFNWSPNGRKIYYYGDNFLNRFDWDKQEETVNKINGIKKADWYFDDNHFLILSGTNLSEIDFDGINKISFTENATNYFLDPRITSFIFSAKNQENVAEYSKFSASFNAF
jgi:hypothetical protein